MQEGISEERLLIGDTDAFGTEMSVYGTGGDNEGVNPFKEGLLRFEMINEEEGFYLTGELYSNGKKEITGYGEVSCVPESLTVLLEENGYTIRVK